MGTIVSSGIVSWVSEIQGKSIILTRSCAGNIDRLQTSDWIEAVDFITQDFGIVFHITWNLKEFADTVLSLLPKDKREALNTTNKIIVDNTKIFYVDRWFGITYTKQIKGNFYDRLETNLFGIQHWMPSDTPQPMNAQELEDYGKSIILALNNMGVKPLKLTSPVGVWEDVLSSYKLPTTFSNNDIIDASLYCELMMRKEWRSAYKIGYFDKAYSFDLRAAYPHFMADLPNTDKCKIVYSDQWLKSDWAIVKAEVDIIKDKTPIVYDLEEGGHILPLGKRIDIFTVEELMWLHNHEAAKIKFIDGYFFKWLTNEKPYKEPIDKLYDIRNSGDEMVSNIARRIGQGISGKLDQDNKDSSFGDLYNPVLAAMTRSRCRLVVADFIWDNNLQDALIAVQVDEVMADKNIDGCLNGNGMGSWRLDAETPALVLGKGEIWRPDKRPLNLCMADVVEVMKAHPLRHSYNFNDGIFIDLAVMQSDIDRIYDKYPRNGKEALNNISESKPMTL